VNDNSQLKKMAHELLDKIGPRLVGTPNMQQAAYEYPKQYSLKTGN
jgi:hypothetical protein